MNATADSLERDPPDDELLAAELALGVLDANARRAAQTRVRDDAAFAARVVAWERRLGGLLDEIAPVAVPAHVWTRLRERLGWTDAASARHGLWGSLAFWRGLGFVGLAAAIALSVTIARQGEEGRGLPAPVPTPIVVVPPPIAPAPVVTLASDAGAPAYLASLDIEHARVRVMPVPAAPDAGGRVPELWLIPAGEKPRSLGVIDTTQAREIEIPADLRRALVSGSLLAVTLEPPGGAPGGVPTGPIVAKGGI
jgi:anti-sigma-K factor RskA